MDAKTGSQISWSYSGRELPQLQTRLLQDHREPSLPRAVCLNAVLHTSRFL